MIQRLKILVPMALFGVLGTIENAFAGGRSEPWQMGFQQPSSPVMEKILDFHNIILILQTAIVLFVLGEPDGRFQAWNASRFETRAFDHVLFGTSGTPVVELEASLISWRNDFTFEVFGERGSAHINGLCKWGPSRLTVRRRVFPSGKPQEDVQVLECADPSWDATRTGTRGQVAARLWVVRQLAFPKPRVFTPRAGREPVPVPPCSAWLRRSTTD